MPIYIVFAIQLIGTLFFWQPPDTHAAREQPCYAIPRKLFSWQAKAKLDERAIGCYVAQTYTKDLLVASNSLRSQAQRTVDKPYEVRSRFAPCDSDDILG